ncbi:RecQ family ATP-dependent DNA helicase [Myxococcota bacterium]|nr:RecQ family ATP-dependent DNA helicase [Myxococcota bacterium]
MGADGTSRFAERCLLLDLEVSRDGVIHHIGAVLGARTLDLAGGRDLERSLAALEDLAADADVVLGHNIVAHDLRHLEASRPGLRLLTLPAVDTLVLSSLAFPKNPYHPLIKTHQDGALKGLVRNDPVADARLAWRAFEHEWEVLARAVAEGQTAPALFRACFEHTRGPLRGTAVALAAMGAPALSRSALGSSFRALAAPHACSTAVAAISATLDREAPIDLAAVAFTTAWLPVAGAKSILPHWARRTHPEVVALVHQLRSRPCDAPECEYCAVVHEPRGQLRRYFALDDFVPKPEAPGGGSLQEAIVRSGMGDRPLLAIVPTGGGKSIGYQLPALVRAARSGALTIVISPLQALMKDQVDGLNRRTGSDLAAALHGMLTTPERAEILSRTRMGEIAILYVSPEQLRNRSFRRTIEAREIGAWVFDEAHCLSQWGHDFRPDYLYAARFIEEHAKRQGASIPPVQAFTATAKVDVKQEILEYFEGSLQQSLEVFEAGVHRANLSFEVRATDQGRKFADVEALVREQLESAERGSVIVYLSTQARTRELAEHLRRTSVPDARHFHGGLDPSTKRQFQEEFLSGRCRVICATNAFGMGIDKPDVRLVVHADVPGSLEAYLQEAGRAGRDGRPARCVLLYADGDVERQFRLTSMSRLGWRDITVILRAIRRRARGPERQTWVTVDELLRDDEVGPIYERDERGTDTKVKNAIGWLERQRFIERDENDTRVFQGRLRARTLDEAKRRIEGLQPPLHPAVKRRWQGLLEALTTSAPDEALSADELAMRPELRDSLPRDRDASGRTASELVMDAFLRMARLGLVEDGLLCTAYLRWKIADASKERLARVVALDRELLAVLREVHPDGDDGRWHPIYLRALNQQLVERGHVSTPDGVRVLLRSLALDGRGVAGHRPTLDLQYESRELHRVRLLVRWAVLEQAAERRRAIASVVFRAIAERLPAPEVASAHALAQFALADLAQALDADLALKSQVADDPLAALERGLMFLHDLGVILLQKGLAVFRQAMGLRVLDRAKGRGWTFGDHRTVEQHQSERTFQIHVMDEYAHLGLDDAANALRFVDAYFSLGKGPLVATYFRGREEMLKMATTAESFRTIVEALRNPEQEAIVQASPAKNLLVLAGPGSGKTRVLVHRVAWLVRVQRIRPSAILVLAFNRSAAHVVRTRLRALIGDEARGVTVQTFHGLALRLVGKTLTNEGLFRDDSKPEPLDAVIDEATALLGGDEVREDDDADDLRQRALAGWSHILVDEYQDIDEAQYRLISALAGRTRPSAEEKLSLLAVGDDDQNIYAFRRTDTKFIRRFEEDYRAKKYFLVDNYRSTGHIVAAANLLITKNRDRMKTGAELVVDRRRRSDPPGGRWAELEPAAGGRVSIVSVPSKAAQARAVVEHLGALARLDPELAWSSVAVLARHRADLDPVRMSLDAAGIPVRWTVPREKMPPLFKLREVAHLLSTLRERGDAPVSAAEARALIGTDRSDAAGPWRGMLHDVVDAWAVEMSETPQPARHLAQHIAEALLELRRSQAIGRGVLLSTIHSAKGLELDHVVLLDPGPMTDKHKGDVEEERRVLYVGMTRAKETLTLFSRDDVRSPLLDGLQGPSIVHRRASPGPATAIQGRFEILGLDEVYVDYGARFGPRDVIHEALRALEPGDEVRLVARKEQVFIEDCAGRPVGLLSMKKGAPRWLRLLPQVRRARVVALVRRELSDLGESYDALCRSWEVPLVEVELRG